MKRVARIFCRVIGWAVLYVVTLIVIGVYLGIGMGLHDMHREGDAFKCVVVTVVSVGMAAALGMAWHWIFRLVRRLP